MSGASLAPLMTRQLSRRCGVLERATTHRKAAPCFVMAESRAEADREIAHFRTAYPARKGPLLVMVYPSHRDQESD